VRRALRIGKPIAKQVSRYPTSDTPIGGLAPVTDLLTHLVNKVFSELALEIVEVKHAALRLLTKWYLWNIRREEAATFTNILVIQVSLKVSRVVALRLGVWRVQNRIWRSLSLVQLPIVC
jgi:hypothetical protein